MKSLTVGKRIVLGFSLLIIIAVALGVVAVVQMNGVQQGSTRLAEAYIPEVADANNIERNFMLAMYENRGYAYTERESFYRESRQYQEETLRWLDAARKLAQEQDLAGMGEAEPKIRSLVEEYSDLTERSKAAIAGQNRARQMMDESAGSFVENASGMIATQERKMARDVEERLRKVTLTSQVMERGNNARVLNFKAQAEGDMAFAEAALDSLDEAMAALDELRPITRDAEDIRRIKVTATAIEDYRGAIEGYLAEYRKGEEADEAVLAGQRTAMDTAAGEFAGQVRDFMDGQTAKMEANITERSNKISWMNSVIDLGNDARVNNFRSQAQRDPQYMETAMARIGEMDSYFQQLEPITRDAEDIAAMKQTAAAAQDYQEAMREFLGQFRELENLNDQRVDVGTEALELAVNLATLGMEETEGIANESKADLATASTIMLAGLVIAVILGVVLALYLTRSIVSPLNVAIASLTSGANETSSASGQVSSSSQSLAEGASEQAASLEETSSSMEEMTSKVARNAELAKTTNEHAKAASTAASEGVRSMGDLRERADAVSTSAKEMEEAMNAIKQSSDSISKIIKTIDEIAFQTNILALNAAVEAARAGEAGAGFAVVADEVRSLARRAAEAARETAGMIEDSMERSERGVQVNEMVGKNLRDVLEKAQQVEDGLQGITGSVGQVSEAMDELEASVNEQQDGIAQINTAVGQVNEVTQENAASAEEAASAAEEMNAQSVNLMEIVGTLTEMVQGTRAEDNHAMVAPQRQNQPVKKTTKSLTTKKTHSGSSGSPGGSGNGSSGARKKEQSFSLPGDFN